jgi:hypothetical protein
MFTTRGPFGRGLLLPECGDDIASIDLQGMFFLGAHQIYIELGNACFLKRPQSMHVGRYRPHGAVAIDDGVGHELGIRASDLSVVEIIIALTVMDIAGELVRKRGKRLPLPDGSDSRGVLEPCRP